MSAPTSSGLGIATATLSPVASYEIGQYFKSKDAEGSTAHILAHTVLGAAVAAAGGNDALTAGLSAGGAEAAAPKLAKYLYGKDAKDLTADEKSTISAITGLVASGVGATTGDVSSTVQSGQVVQNAVENNSLAGDDLRKNVNDFFNGLSSKVKHPIDQGAIKGLGSVADGLLMISDAFGDTAVSAIHCPLGSSACADAMENNRMKGQAVIDFLKINNLKKQAAAIEQSYIDLNSGDPEKVANAQRTQMEVFTSLGVGAIFSKTSTINNKPVAGATSFMTKDDAFYKFASKRSDIDPNGMYDVIAHGAPNKIEITVNGKAILIDQRTASQLIQKSEGYQKGQPIRLLSCSTGSCDVGFAQNLANKMGVPVQAPTDLVWSYPNGKMVIAPRLSNNPSKPGYNQPNLSKIGEFKIFTPGGNKK
ncbi:VENN motif pre-toxin domain-containing protein [Acinetobacter bereziniae]|uniref:VENN motif pre-toxin domain-containing protein n=1 Tax=Acinetobacter bereziniae TaxID=106648 RepID=UPI00208E6E50|nr:VENN motif pre-toxin domain-containing protein [Acinetobacter bereziniae]